VGPSKRISKNIMNNNPFVIVSLSTVPERLHDNIYGEYGVKKTLITLCEQSYKNYEVHFNLPEFSKVTNIPYVLPEWLGELQSKYEHFKVHRTEDFGPPTKIVPTIMRVSDPETILIAVDDDLIYHTDMVQEHVNHHQEIDNAAFGYDGRDSQNEVKYNDLRDCWVNCVEIPTEVNWFQNYKSGSYKRKYFESDFFEHFLNKTQCDDMLLSFYLRYKGIKLIVMPYKPDLDKIKTYQDWGAFQCVETFPVIANSGVVCTSTTGANHPELIKKEVKFYVPPLFVKWAIEKKITYEE